jgi:hypothetical protein
MPFCVHGHFYQPPREDPISNYIPDERGAEPFHNWNEKILQSVMNLMPAWETSER